MNTNSILPMKARLAPARESSFRRTSHGGSAFQNELQMTQPQDGAVSKVSSIAARLQHGFGAEPEDARLTGVTRSLFRRLTGLNVMAAPAPTKPAAAISVLAPKRAAVAATLAEQQVA